MQRKKSKGYFSLMGIDTFPRISNILAALINATIAFFAIKYKTLSRKKEITKEEEIPV